MEPTMNAMNDLARKLAASVPGDAAGLRGDLERNFLSLLRAAFERMDLVTREEFDVQRKVLERTREKLATVEAEVAALEARLDGGAIPGDSQA
jgi:BMFP domain-containing protein YqiC